jgi:hypothetical protein
MNDPAHGEGLGLGIRRRPHRLDLLRQLVDDAIRAAKAIGIHCRVRGPIDEMPGAEYAPMIALADDLVGIAGGLDDLQFHSLLSQPPWLVDKT